MRPPRFLSSVTAGVVAALPALTPWSTMMPWAPCATAQLLETEVDTRGTWLVTFGAAVQCAPTVADGAVAIAGYPVGQPNGVLRGIRAFATADPGTTRSFGAPTALLGTAGDYGVCVLNSTTDRIACAWVTVVAGRPTWTAPIPVTDPRVDKGVRSTGSVPGDGPGGNCGTCF